MIWALLEITIPLCLAYLFGLFAGWFLWRWRRRQVSASDWQAQVDNGTALQSLQSEHQQTISQRDEIASQLEQVSSTVESQNSQLKESDSKLQKLAGELVEAKKTPQPPVLKNNNAEVQLKAQLEQADEKYSDLLNKLGDIETRANQQAQQNSELQQKLKQSEMVATERDTAMAKITELESKLSGANLSDNELSQTKAQLASLDQKFKNFQASVVANRQTSDDEKQQLQSRIQQLQTSLQQEKELSANNQAQHANQQSAAAQRSGSDNELRETRTKLAEVTAQLNNEKSRRRNLENAASNNEATAAAPVTSISVGQIKKLKSDIAAKDEKIASLQKKLKSKPAKSKKKSDWQSGETKLGTPGCNHKDDLTAINGIGPKIEKVLNRQGIKSWEQLATLKVAEIKRLDDALVDFSGRITRDEWVPQAKAILQNDHQPLNSKAKTRKKPKAATKPKNTAKKNKKPGKNAWQKGKTKFGTPGSNHRDDLKVINGIGPVIEKALNRYGIRSWEQLAALKVKDSKAIDTALDFPGRIDREQWIKQAKALVKRFPDAKQRPTRRTFLNQAAS